MKFLITGHEGFIGRHLSAYLTHKGHDVEGFEWMPNVMPNPKPYDSVIHLGAISSTTERDIEKVMEQNYEFSMRLLQSCDEKETPLIYASSASVYGDAFAENSKLQPQSPYSWSKYLFDRFVTQMPKSMVKVQGLRFFNVYGSGETHKGDQQSVFGKFEKQARETGVIKVFEGSDKILRDFIHVGDVCEIIEKFISVDSTGIWNLGTGNPRSFMDIAKIYAHKYNAEIEEIPMPDALKSQYQYYTCSDNNKLINSIGVHNFKTIEEYAGIAVN